MIFEAKTITLKDGGAALLRSPRPGEAAEMLEFMKALAGETHFVIRYPEEWREPPENEAAFLEHMVASDNALMIVCEIGGQIAGNCQITFNSRIKTRHRASIGIGLRREYWNLGIGTAMLGELIAAARARGIAQIELDYIEGNARARALYEKMGFEQVAVRPDAIRLRDGTPLCEISMVKKL
ncbi:MAG: GNAT family N-acetyltransferase [Clostridia bacterium]|nr:GNAT family N-acetyltransferase [Clostridia bacterium]